MKKLYIILTAALIVFVCINTHELIAQDMKAPSGAGQAYPNLSVDMQYYEIKYDPNSNEYLSYYKAVREKIIQKLKGMYRYHYRNGDVHLVFTLNSDGRLDGFDIDYMKSVQDKTLLDIAATSLKRSSPFPKFPTGLSYPKVSFNVVISFKEK